MRLGGAMSPFPIIWRKISVHVELRGIVGGHVWLKSDPSILLDGPEVGPRDCSAWGCFYSSRFSAIRVSVAMKWFTLCIISGTVVGGFFTKDHSSLDEPQKAATCSVGSELPSHGSKVGSLKLVGIGLSRISGVKDDPCLELPPASSFDLVTSFCTSSSRFFTWRSCTQSESVESDDSMSGSREVSSTPRYGVVDLSGMIEGVSDQIFDGSRSVVSGRVAPRGPESPLDRPGAAGAPVEVEPWTRRAEECGG
ncbi:hypothetical protein B296_00038987 [Ensete ventricosum]|uniref:Uncharacterized protein n=1 Tax=Ensete ventricosum TaxID=4639 RepID=A0A426XD68_ENSVE|nr:hypothetical protein B296_00038987 [Ensete ventricosum]